MIIVIVEHFLNEAGQKDFPEWVEEVEKVLDRWPGFINLQRIKKVEQPEATWLILRFETLPLLRAWAASEDHEYILGLLTPYRWQKQRSQIFEVKP